MAFTIEWVDECHGPEHTRVIQTPVGRLSVQRCGDVICGLDWLTGDQEGPASDHGEYDPVESYWREPLAEVELKLLRRGSAFVQKVQKELLKIPFGATVSYKALAERVGSAPRAVGGACRRNDYLLIVPCHRVVSVAGPGGYSGQRQGEWMSIKLKLLEFEATFKR